ncbi:MAG: ADP-ribosylglycohydrolase family protein [Nostoc sp.]|uniref:ADP-ribosylglycohydrolase family protein n=1 Tax=Nostoc sp. TaxID=1180 RepID=UPI002FFB5A64
MLLELGIANAYGARFEYSDEIIVNNDFSRYVEHPRFQLNPGNYTDDTQMSIAIAEVTTFFRYSYSNSGKHKATLTSTS